MVDNEYYTGSAKATITINKANPNVTWPSFPETYYEDRLNVESMGNASSETPGEFIYGNVYYGSGQTSISYKGNGYVSSGNGIVSQLLVEFVPIDTDNYNTLNTYVSIEILPVAFNGNYYYGTVEKALADAGGDNSDSGKTVEIIIGANPIIRNNATIGSGITLSIPTYGVVTDDTACTITVDKTTKLAYSKTATLCKNSGGGSYAPGYQTGECHSTLEIADGIILSNAGTINIGGFLSGAQGGVQFAGHTAITWAEIKLHANAEIISTGAINCYGFIKETSINNGSKVTISSGTIGMPYILRDFSGGGPMYTMYNSASSIHCSPFSQFEIRNVQSILEIGYYGTLNVWANLHANQQVNSTTVNLIGNSTSSVIQLTNSTYSKSISKFNYQTEVIDLDLYGGAKTNKMDLKIKVLITITVSTDNVYFPISWQYDVSLNQGEGQQEIAIYNIGQRMKVMTGAKLEVGKGVELTANDLIVYSEYDLSKVTYTYAGTPYPLKDPGKLIVNGKLIATNLAGAVYTEIDGAELIVTGKTSGTWYEPIRQSGSGFSTDVEYLTTEETLKAYVYKGGSSLRELSAGSYISKDKAWYSDNCTIFYNPNGGELTGVSSEGPYATGTNGYYVGSISANVGTPIREHYIFGGWYSDQKCTDGNELIGSTLYSNTFVYAKWIPIEYYIKYNVINSTGDTFTYELENEKFTIEDILTLSSISYGNYVFDGWYTDYDNTNNELTNKISQFIPANFTGKLTSEGAIVDLYCQLLPSTTKTYKLSFVDQVYGYTFESQTIIEGKEDIYSIPDLSIGINNDDSIPYYFVGWIDQNGNAFELGTKITQDTVLYATWNNKISVTYNYYVADQNFNVILQKFYVPGDNVVLLGSVGQLNVDGLSSLSGLTAVWFVDDPAITDLTQKCNSNNFYVGGYKNTIDVSISVYGDFYYVIDGEKYANSTDKASFASPAKTSTKVLFKNVDFTNEELEISVTASSTSQGNISRNRISNFSNMTATHIILDNCIINSPEVNKTHDTGNYTSTILWWSTEYYMHGYNGIFNGCSLLTNVIFKNTDKKNQMFSNCDKLTTVIDKDGTTLLDISTLKPTDDSKPHTGNNLVGA